MSGPYTVQAAQQNGFQNTADDLELVLDTTMPHASTYVAGSQRSVSQAQAGSSAVGDDVRCHTLLQYCAYTLPLSNCPFSRHALVAAPDGVGCVRAVMQIIGPR